MMNKRTMSRIPAQARRNVLIIVGLLLLMPLATGQTSTLIDVTKFTVVSVNEKTGQYHFQYGQFNFYYPEKLGEKVIADSDYTYLTMQGGIVNFRDHSYLVQRGGGTQNTKYETKPFTGDTPDKIVFDDQVTRTASYTKNIELSQEIDQVNHIRTDYLTTTLKDGKTPFEYEKIRYEDEKKTIFKHGNAEVTLVSEVLNALPAGLLNNPITDISSENGISKLNLMNGYEMNYQTDAEGTVSLRVTQQLETNKPAKEIMTNLYFVDGTSITYQNGRSTLQQGGPGGEIFTFKGTPKEEGGKINFYDKDKNLIGYTVHSSSTEKGEWITVTIDGDTYSQVKTEMFKDTGKQIVTYYEKKGSGEFTKDHIIRSVETEPVTGIGLDGQEYTGKHTIERDEKGNIVSDRVIDTEGFLQQEILYDDNKEVEYTLYFRNGIRAKMKLPNGEEIDIINQEGKERDWRQELEDSQYCKDNKRKCEEVENRLTAEMYGLWEGSFWKAAFDFVSVLQHLDTIYQSAATGQFFFNLFGGNPDHEMFPGANKELDKWIVGGELQAHESCMQFLDTRTIPTYQPGETSFGMVQGKVRWFDQSGQMVLALIINGERSDLLKYPNATNPDEDWVEEYFYKMEFKVDAKDGDLRFNVRLRGIDEDGKAVTKNNAFPNDFIIPAGSSKRYMGSTAYVSFSPKLWQEFCLVFSAISDDYRDALGGNEICTEFIISNAGVESFDFSQSSPGDEGWNFFVPVGEGDQGAPAENDEGYNPPNPQDDGEDDTGGWAR